MAYMSENSSNRISELRKLRGMTQQALAEAVGAHWITISKLERGKLPLTFEWAERLGKALSVGEYDVFRTRFAANTVFIDGIITDGGYAYYYKDEEGNLEHEVLQVEVETIQSPLKNWFLIENDAFFPFFQSGDIVQSTGVDLDQEVLFLNKLCIVSTPIDDSDKLRGVLGFLVRGKNKGYDLNILSGAPIRNIKIDHIQTVTMALFNPAVWDQRTGRPRSRSEET